MAILVFSSPDFPAISALRKQKKYDWKDSNMALFGSDTERSFKSKPSAFLIGYSFFLLILRKTRCGF